MLSISQYLTVFDIVNRAHIGLLTKPELNLWKGYSAGMVMCTYIYISSSTKAYHLSDMVLQTSRFIKSILIQITKYSVKKELKWILTPDVQCALAHATPIHTPKCVKYTAAVSDTTNITFCVHDSCSCTNLCVSFKCTTQHSCKASYAA